MSGNNNRIENRLVWAVLDIGTPFGGRLNHGISSETRAKHNLSAEAGRWRTTLYPKAYSEKLTKLEGQIRRWYYKRTAPWGGGSNPEKDLSEDRDVNVAALDSVSPDKRAGSIDTGMHVLPAAILVEVERERAALQAVWNALSDSIASKYDELLEACKDLHKETFNRNWYPASATVFRAKCRFQWEIFELPGRGHWLLDLPNEMLEDMNKRADARSLVMLADMKRSLVGRFVKPLTEFVEKLKGGGDFKATRWERLEGLANDVEKLNVDGDPAIAGFLNDLRRVLAVDPTACRDSDAVRQATVAEAKKVADRMAELFG